MNRPLYLLVLFFYAPLLLSAAGEKLCAQPMLLNLPKDGSWATYKYHGTVQSDSRIQSDWEGPMTVRCVGTEYENMEALRWIEFDQKFTYEGTSRRVVIKVQIPEKHIGAGKDPMPHVKKCWICNHVGSKPPAPLVPKEYDLKTNAMYREMVYQYLTPPLEKKNDLEMKWITVNNHKLQCAGMRCSVELDFTKSSKKISKRTFDLFTHSNSPFGLVRSTYKIVDETRLGEPFANRKYVKTGTCQLIQSGTDAESVLPDCK